jgi:Secretion system C-terminal sorting domain
MKKQLLVFALAAVSSLLSAQAPSFVIYDENGTAVQGTTQTYWVPSSVTDVRHYASININSSSLSVKVRKTVLQINDAGATTWFCTDQLCYAPTTIITPTAMTVGAGSQFDLSIDFNPNGVTGVTQVRYSIINQANTADSTWFIVVYNIAAGPAGVNPAVIVKPSVSNPSPNPASSVFNMSYKLGTGNTQAKMVVYNMLGESVMVETITDAEGTIRMDVSTLDQGVYFCSLEADGKTLLSRRLVVTH